ncbi:MAG: hypothetical protein K8S24_02420 [Candidatus Aegiribacteria sp.]|nr:hypothetical protein [Candidatus Aegiribacteria sp.]
MRIAIAAVILLLSTSVSSVSIGIRAGALSLIEMPQDVAPLSSGIIGGLEVQYRFSPLASLEIAWFTGNMKPSEDQKIFEYPFWSQEGSYSTGMAGFRFWLSNVYLAADFVYQYTKVDWYDAGISEDCSWRSYRPGGSVALGWKLLPIMDIQCRILTPVTMFAFTVLVSFDLE